MEIMFKPSNAYTLKGAHTSPAIHTHTHTHIVDMCTCVQPWPYNVYIKMWVRFNFKVDSISLSHSIFVSSLSFNANTKHPKSWEMKDSIKIHIHPELSLDVSSWPVGFVQGGIH